MTSTLWLENVFINFLNEINCGRCIGIKWVLANSGKSVLIQSLLVDLKRTEVVLKLLSLLLPWLPVSGLEFIDGDNTEKLILLFKQHCPILLHPGYFCSVEEITDGSFRISNHTFNWNTMWGSRMTLLALLNLTRAFSF